MNQRDASPKTEHGICKIVCDNLSDNLHSPEILKNLISKTYQKIFNENMTEGVEVFLKNMSHVGLGVIIESILTFVFQIVGGNVLGPTEYGKYTLVISIGMLLYVPMFFGINTAMVKYNTEKKETARQQIIISTSGFLVLILTVGWAVIYLLSTSIILKTFSISKDVFYSAVLFSIFYGYFVFATDILRSLHEIKKFSILRPIFGFILISSFIIYSPLVEKISFISMIIPMYLAYVIIGISAFFMIYKYTRLTFSTYWAKNLMKYGLFTMLNSISFILFLNIDKILINKYMSTKDIGIFNAYDFSSLKIISLFTVILVTVLFPMISKYESKKEIIGKVNKLIPYFIILGIPSIMFSEYVALKLYGTDYPIDISLIIIFAITSILFLIYEIYIWIFSSIGIKGVKLTMYSTCLIAILDILFDIYLIPRYGLHGAIGATLISYFAGINTLYILWKKSGMI